MPLSLESVLELLSASKEGRAFPAELRDKRYVVVHGIDVDALRDPPDEGDEFYEKAKKWIGGRVVGETTDFESALRMIWQSIAELKKQFGETDDDEPWQSHLSTVLSEGPWGVPDDEVAAATEFGVSQVKTMFPKSRYEFAFYGDAPYEGESAAVLELPPKVKLAAKDKNLLAASKKNDLERVRALLAQGANPRVANEYGNTALHHAVAHRNRTLVECLIEAGADPNASAHFFHAPIFAQHTPGGRTLPRTDQFDDENHFALACYLIEHGANPLVTRPHGQTLVDLAANRMPMNARWVRYFLDCGVLSRLLRTTGVYQRPLDSLLSSLQFLSREERARIPDKVRLLGWLGCNPNDPEGGYGKETPVEQFLTTGYYHTEVESEVLIDIVQALVDIGARNDPGLADPRRPSERAEMWSKKDRMAHYAEAARILKEGLPLPART